MLVVAGALKRNRSPMISVKEIVHMSCIYVGLSVLIVICVVLYYQRRSIRPIFVCCFQCV
jgi:hypothetical protein